MLGHAGIAIAPDGVDLDAPARRRGKVDEAGSAGAKKNDVPKVRATRQQVGIEEGMVVDADVEAIEEGWQPIGLAVGDIDLNGWVFRPPYTVPELDHAGEAVQKEYRHRDRPACQRQSIRRATRHYRGHLQPAANHVSRSVAPSRVAIGQNAVATHPFLPVPGQSVLAGRSWAGAAGGRRYSLLFDQLKSAMQPGGRRTCR